MHIPNEITLKIIEYIYEPMDLFYFSLVNENFNRLVKINLQDLLKYYLLKYFDETSRNTVDIYVKKWIYLNHKCTLKSKFFLDTPRERFCKTIDFIQLIIYLFDIKIDKKEISRELNYYHPYKDTGRWVRVGGKIFILRSLLYPQFNAEMILQLHKINNIELEFD